MLNRKLILTSAMIGCLFAIYGCGPQETEVTPEPVSSKPTVTYEPSGYVSGVTIIDLTGYLVPTDEEPTIEDPAEVLDALWEGMASDPKTKAILSRMHGGLDVTMTALKLPKDFKTSGNEASRELARESLREQFSSKPTPKDAVIYEVGSYQPGKVADAEVAATRFRYAYRFEHRIGDRTPTLEEWGDISTKNQLGGLFVAANDYLLRNIKGWQLDTGTTGGFWNPEIKEPINAEKARTEIAETIVTREAAAKEYLKEVRQILSKDEAP